MRTILWCVAAVLLLGTGAARAQVEQYPETAGTIIPIGETTWSATAGRTVGSGNSVVQAEVGWPGVSLTYLHGASERTDFGARSPSCSPSPTRSASCSALCSASAGNTWSTGMSW